jgi:hypothetical protein
VIEPAPSYLGEGPHALWHVSENPAIERFVPQLRHEHAVDEPLVWAVDTRHLPLYWFPRDCPRATYWACGGTTDEDVAVFLDGSRSRRVHVTESSWLDRMRDTPVYAYRLPAGTFERRDRFWVSRDAVEPLELVELGDLVELHRAAGVELRSAGELLALWDKVVKSTLDFSGIRLRNATLAS